MTRKEKGQSYCLALTRNGAPELVSDIDILVGMDSDEPMAQRMRRVTEVAKVRFLPMDVIVRTPDEMAERLAMKILPRRDPGEGEGAVSP